MTLLVGHNLYRSTLVLGEFYPSSIEFQEITDFSHFVLHLFIKVKIVTPV